MIFKKFCDYGGYSCGWKCIFCGEIVDLIQENRQWLKEGVNKKQGSEEAYCDDM